MSLWIRLCNHTYTHTYIHTYTHTYICCGLTATVTWAACMHIWAAPRTGSGHTHARWAADIRHPSVREHLWSVAVRLAYLPHHRRLCTHLRPCGRRSGSEIIFFTLGTQLLPQHVFSATITSSPHVRILVLLLGLK